jgi:hypothetical protein
MQTASDRPDQWHRHGGTAMAEANRMPSADFLNALIHTDTS